MKKNKGMSECRETNRREKAMGQYIDFGLYWESVENFEDKWDIIFLFCKKDHPSCSETKM